MEMPVWKRILKGLAWLCGGVLALILVAYLSLVAINWRDRPPSPATLRLAAVERDRQQVSDADNGYIYAQGFAAPPNVDPHDAGVRRVEWLRKRFYEKRNPAASDPVPADESYKSARAPGAQALASACQSVQKECVVAVEGGETTMREWIGSEQWLLDRYLTLVRRPGWIETVPFESLAPLPRYSMMFDGHILLLSKAYLLAAQKDAVGVRDLLSSDVRFWRRVLASSDILITKMIAVAALNRHFAVGNLILRRLPADLQMAGMPQEWTAPLTDDERSLLRTFVGEWNLGNSVFGDAFSSGDWVGAVETDPATNFADRLLGRALVPLFQRQDTSNRRAEMFIRTADTMNVPFEQFAQALQETQRVFDDPGSEEGPFGRLYNPLGKLLLAIGPSDFGSYGARVSDIEGSRRAAMLAAELRNRKVDPRQVVSELGASVTRSPYDGLPFGWDDESQSIVFLGLEARQRGRHSFKY